ncbi:MAG: hypothetical protein JG782_595, partial [Anaerophaga sp.]|nr:hypothetical protein [Anaerophaga sp.]
MQTRKILILFLGIITGTINAFT